MKKSFLSILFLSAFAYRMADDAPAATGDTPAPSQESLLARIEALFERGVEGVEGALHDALSVIEGMFATDNDTEEDAGPTDVVSGVDAPVTGNAATSAGADTGANAAAPASGETGNIAGV